MVSDYLSYKKNENLKPVEIINKETYFFDLLNIEYNFTGRVDAWLANTFIQESVQLIVNAINLFEMGYFDCAYYSLRQSLELSTTMIYLFDIDDDKKEEELKKWKANQQFPMYAQMMRFLTEHGAVFKDLNSKMSSYFNNLDSVKNKLNKYVHKQGLDKFYVSRNHPISILHQVDKFIDIFESHLKKCIGAIAVLRLGIDPFPILLNDEEIYRRTGDLLSEPYSDDFIEGYIGLEHINDYKETDLYQEHYKFFMNLERMKECVTKLVKHQCVDTEKIDEILEQKHLISEVDLVVVLICYSSPKPVKVYTMGGIMPYFTDRNTERTRVSWDSRDFVEFKETTPSFNIPYDEAFITCIVINEQDYFIEHNEPLTIEEVEKLKQIEI